MTDTVRVPRDTGPNFSDSTLPEEMIYAGIAVFDQVDADNANYVAGETTDWDQGMIVVAIYRAMLAASPQGEGSSADWIKHDGGPNPVPGKMVEVRFKDGCTGEPLDSECYGWGWHPDPDTAPAYDIIAYRVTEGVKP